MANIRYSGKSFTELDNWFANLSPKEQKHIIKTFRKCLKRRRNNDY